MEKKMEHLITEYRLMLCRLAFTYLKTVEDAEDVVQDVFVYLLTRNVEFENEEHERAWLLRAVIHRSINQLKKRSRQDVSWQDYMESAEGESAETNAEDNMVLEAVLALDEKYKAVIYLYYFEGYDQNEIAGMLDIPLSTVKTRMVRGRKRLKVILKEVFDYEE